MSVSGGGGISLVPYSFLDPRSLLGGYVQGESMSRPMYTGGVGIPEKGRAYQGVEVYPPTWDLGYLPPPTVLTPSGGHHNTFGWQAGETQPTGILSCKHM